MNRREFLGSAIALLAPRIQDDAAWKTFEVTTHVHVHGAGSTTRVWLPTPLAVAPYQKTLGDNYTIDGGSVTMVEREGLDLLAAQWTDGAEPILTLESRVATTEYRVDFATPAVPPPRDLSAFSSYLRAMKVEGYDDSGVKAAAASAARGAGTDLERARALFESVTREGGPDPSALFVGLARATGIPARPVYGLGLSQPDASRAQKARAEVYLVGYGWTPVDVSARRFGSWDARWMAYNSEQDVVLPGSSGKAVREFMRPHGETDRRPIDNLDPEAFRYSIAVREL
jgi:hypothetical protein